VRAETVAEREQAKQEAERSMAPRLLRRVQSLLGGRLVSGDARYCQQALCRQIVQAGGAYRFAVKANQPALLADVSLLFQAPPPGARGARASTVTTHGGRLEIRHLRASAALAAYLQAAGWPAVGLVLAVARTVRWPPHPARPLGEEVRSFLRSLPATWRPLDLLALTRRHGHSEHRLHWIRDVTLGEDACQVRSGQAPQVLAALRTAVVGLLRRHRVPNLAAALRANAWTGPAAILGLLGLKL
jgi:predicted transposase YbfD/YdcC